MQTNESVAPIMNMNVKAEPDQKSELVLISSWQKDPAFIARAAFEQFQRENSGVPRMCTWCGASVDNVQLCRCVDKDCFEGLHSCGPCMVIAHEQRPFHALDMSDLFHYTLGLTGARIGLDR
jgi:hypothetical protein